MYPADVLKTYFYFILFYSGNKGKYVHCNLSFRVGQKCCTNLQIVDGHCEGSTI